MGYALAIGISLSRKAWLGACSEIANFTGISSLINCLIHGIIPAVEIVICLLESEKPASCLSIISIAFFTFS